MSDNCRKITMCKFEKERTLNYIEKNINENSNFEIDFYSQNFKYNGESIKEIEEVLDRWKNNEVLYRMEYYQEQIKNDCKYLEELTDEFILKEINDNDDVIIFFDEIYRLINKYITLFFGAIKPDYRRISEKLRDSGYKITLKVPEELKKYSKDYETMAYISDEKEEISNIFINDMLESFSRNEFNLKIGKGINVYTNRFIRNNKKVMQKK